MENKTLEQWLLVMKCVAKVVVKVVGKTLSACLHPAQEKAEGEPKVKKGKTLLDDDDDGDNEEEGVDESLEEVRE